MPCSNCDQPGHNVRTCQQGGSDNNDEEIGMPEELALQISQAVHQEWNDEQVDTFEELDGFAFPNFDAIISQIMIRDDERKNEGWGEGSLKLNEVINAVSAIIPADYVYA